LEEYVDDVNKKFGGNHSIRFPGQSLDDGTYPIWMHAGDGVRPLMLAGQEECIFYQFLLSSKSWQGPSGEHLILPKGEGEGIMYSAFTARELGFGYALPDVQLRMMNQNRLGTEYLSKEEAILLRGSVEKQPITREQFDNDLVGSPFLKSFRRYAKNHEGYWTNRHMKLQLEDVGNCLCVAFPDFDFLFLFDQSSGHTKKRDDGLPTQNMNVEFGGKVSEMRHSHLFEGCKTCAELVTNIQATQLTLEQREYHLKELQELAVSCNLDIWVVEQRKIEGWAGKPKGLFQVLWETG
jgi:hypothetical protein